MAAPTHKHMWEEIERSICDKWHISEMKEFQREAIKNVVFSRRDILLCMPTGSGKSLCFEALPTAMSKVELAARHARRHTTTRVTASGTAEKRQLRDFPRNPVVLVVSPLVSLIKSQVTHLKSLGMSAVDLCSEDVVDAASVLQSGEIRYV